MRMRMRSPGARLRFTQASITARAAPFVSGVIRADASGQSDSARASEVNLRWLSRYDSAQPRVIRPGSSICRAVAM